MSEQMVHIQRAEDGESVPISIQTIGDESMQVESQNLTQADTDAVNQLINDPEFQRAVQEQVAASSSGETVYVQVTTGAGEQTAIPTSIIINKNVPEDVIQKKLESVTTGNLAQNTLRHELTRPVLVNQTPVVGQQQKLVRPRPVEITTVSSSTPMSMKCVCCNSTTRSNLRSIKGNSIILGVFSDIMSPAFPASEEKFKVCDACIGVMDKMKDMREVMRSNFKAVDSRFDLQPAPVTRTRFREEMSLKRVRTEDDEDRIGEHEYHRSESTYNRSKKAIEISGLLTKQYLNIAPFTDEERLSIAGIINVAAPTELAAKIMKVPALLNAIKKLILLETNHTCEKLCSSTQVPGPSVLRLKGVNTISEDDLISEIIVEMRRCMPFVMDLLFTMCRPLHAPRVDCREIMAIMYAMGMYCRSPALTAVRRINVQKVLSNRNLRQRIANPREK